MAKIENHSKIFPSHLEMFSDLLKTLKFCRYKIKLEKSILGERVRARERERERKHLFSLTTTSQVLIYEMVMQMIIIKL